MAVQPPTWLPPWSGLAVEKNGNIIVVDSGNDRLQVFTPDGTFVGKCGISGSSDGEFNQPWGVTLDNDGLLWLHQGAPLPSSPAEFDACDPISQVAVRVDEQLIFYPAFQV